LIDDADHDDVGMQPGEQNNKKSPLTNPFCSQI